MMRPYHLLTSFLVCIIIPKAALIQTHLENTTPYYRYEC